MLFECVKVDYSTKRSRFVVEALPYGYESLRAVRVLQRWFRAFRLVRRARLELRRRTAKLYQTVLQRFVRQGGYRLRVQLLKHRVGRQQYEIVVECLDTRLQRPFGLPYYHARLEIGAHVAAEVRRSEAPLQCFQLDFQRRELRLQNTVLVDRVVQFTRRRKFRFTLVKQHEPRCLKVTLASLTAGLISERSLQVDEPTARALIEDQDNLAACFRFAQRRLVIVTLAQRVRAARRIAVYYRYYRWRVQRAQHWAGIAGFFQRLGAHLRRRLCVETFRKIAYIVKLNRAAVSAQRLGALEAQSAELQAQLAALRQALRDKEASCRENHTETALYFKLQAQTKRNQDSLHVQLRSLQESFWQMKTVSESASRELQQHLAYCRERHVERTLQTIDQNRVNRLLEQLTTHKNELEARQRALQQHVLECEKSHVNKRVYDRLLRRYNRVARAVMQRGPLEPDAEPDSDSDGAPRERPPPSAFSLGVLFRIKRCLRRLINKGFDAWFQWGVFVDYQHYPFAQRYWFHVLRRGEIEVSALVQPAWTQRAALSAPQRCFLAHAFFAHRRSNKLDLGRFLDIGFNRIALRPEFVRFAAVLFIQTIARNIRQGRLKTNQLSSYLKPVLVMDGKIGFTLSFDFKRSPTLKKENLYINGIAGPLVIVTVAEAALCVKYR